MTQTQTTVAVATAIGQAPKASRCETHLELIGDSVRFRVEERGDIGRNRADLHLADGQLGEVVMHADMQTLGALYIELRRFLGELGGAGPSRQDVRAAIAKMKADAPKAGGQ